MGVIFFIEIFASYQPSTCADISFRSSLSLVTFIGKGILANYSKMIEALNDFDTLITKRIQGTGVPGKGEKDDEMTALLDNVVKQYENMLGAAAAQRE